MEVYCFKGVVSRGGGLGGGSGGGGLGEELYGVCSVCLTGSLSCQHWCGITCSTVSARQ